jgi:hypothetical protein
MLHPAHAPPPQPMTAEAVHAWLHAAQRKHQDLQGLAAQPSHSHQCYEAFIDLAALLQEGLEEVRVISASLREGDQMVRGDSAVLRAYATQLLDQCTESIERLAQLLPEPHEVQGGAQAHRVVRPRPPSWLWCIRVSILDECPAAHS